MITVFVWFPHAADSKGHASNGTAVPVRWVGRRGAVGRTREGHVLLIVSFANWKTK